MRSGLVAVTGATGFLGRRLVERLGADGRPVRILVRSSSAPAAWQRARPEVVVGDLRNGYALSRLVEGADVVVHAAGLIKARSRAEFFEVNAAGAARVASACDGRRLIHISSLAAREPGLSDYAASKRAGEDAVRAFGGDAVAVVRPPAIYGPGDRETLALFKAASAGVAFAPGNPDARVAIAQVDDVAEVVVDLIDRAQLPAMTTIGGDRPDGYTWVELATAAARAVGGHPVIVKVPEWAVVFAGAASEGLGRWRQSAPIFTRGKARELLHPRWSVSIDEEGVTAGRDYTSLDKGFADAVSWYRTHRWLR